MADPARLFLECFPPEHQGPIANFFYEARRSVLGPISPRELASITWNEVKAKLAEGWEGKVDLALVLTVMRDKSNLALAYADHVIRQEARPPSEKIKERQDTERLHREEWMRKQPPTLKQKNFLTSYDLPVPENRFEASEAIEAVLKGKVVG